MEPPLAVFPRVGTGPLKFWFKSLKAEIEGTPKFRGSNAQFFTHGYSWVKVDVEFNSKAIWFSHPLSIKGVWCRLLSAWCTSSAFSMQLLAFRFQLSERAWEGIAARLQTRRAITETTRAVWSVITRTISSVSWGVGLGIYQGGWGGGGWGREPK